MIYNCFTFYDEFMLLDIRLAELSGVVDKFVLVESNYTFSGKQKPLHFSDMMDTGRYDQWKDSIIPIVSMCSQPDKDRWVNEREQRNSLSMYLSMVCKDDDLIILTDADEIPRAVSVESAATMGQPGRFIMSAYYYYFNCITPDPWKWPAFCLYRDFKSIFRDSAQSLRVSQNSTPVHIFNAGWHFGYVMEPERIAEKIGAFSHSEFDNPYFRDMARIERCRQDHTDLFERQVNEFEIVGLNEMPQVIRNNPEKYKDFIYDYESYSRCYSVLPEPQTA